MEETIMSKVRIGVIGCGGMGTNIHLPSLSEIEDCEICAVCDLVHEKADKMAAKYNVPRTYYFHTDMLAAEAGQLDGIVCLVEPDRMYRVVYDCLKAGFNVLMEKPAGINSYQSDSLARTAEAVGKYCGVMMNRRHTPLVQEVLRIMKDELHCNINAVNGTFIKHSDIASGWHYMDAYVSDIIHCVDLVRYMAGGKKVVKAATVADALNGSPVKNAWTSIFTFDNGVRGFLQGNYQTASRVHTFEIHSPEASAFINLGFADKDCEAYILIASKGTIYSKAAAGYAGPGVIKLDGVQIANGESKYYQYYGYKSENADFVDALKNHRPPMVTIADAALSMHMAEDLLAAEL